MPSNLNLIPGSGKEFRDKDYWEKFFKVRGSKAFEWYGEYENLFPILHSYIKPTDKLLVIGCGNSKLSENMYDVGIKDIVNIDLSNVVIQQMSTKNKHRKEMKFLKMDMLNMEFEEKEFDVVVDKGTLDALMSDSSEKVDEDCTKLFDELDRVLKVGGKYMCISLAQNHILEKLLETFKEKGWIIRIHRINEQDLDFHLPVFVFIFTKMKIKIPNTNPIIEIKLDLNIDKFLRVNSIADTKIRVKEYQNYGLTKFHISNKNIDSQDDVFVHLFDGKNQKYPRYTIFIKDSPSNVKASKLNGIFAVFVVPLGKEIEWLFGNKDGRDELRSQAKYQRLAIAHLNRDHSYESLDAIISELSPKVMELAPKGVPSSYKIPLLSLGPELDIREVQYRGSSELSGEFYVEDVKSSDISEPTRMLIFQSIIPTVQTECMLRETKSKKKNDTSSSMKVPDYTRFLEDYFSMMLSFIYSIKIKPDEHLKILIIGLGGGVLACYCKTWLKNCEIDAVEIDEKIAEVAQNYYGLKTDKNMRIHIDDGLKFITESAKQNKKWDIVIIDVNCHDVESELWAPTNDFVQIEFLKTCKTILNELNGIFMMNMICHNIVLRKSILDSLRGLWPRLYYNKLAKGFNEILFCCSQSKEILLRKDPFTNNDTDTNFNKELKSGNTMLLLEEVLNYLKEI